MANKKCKKKKEHLMTILFLWMQSLEWAHRKYVCGSKMSAIIHKKGNMHKMMHLFSHFYHYLALKKQQIVDNSLWNFFFFCLLLIPLPLFDLWLQFLISGIYSMWLWEQSNVFALHQAESWCNAFMVIGASNTSCLPTLHLVIWSQLCLNLRQ